MICDTCERIHGRDTRAPIQCPSCNRIVGCFYHDRATEHIRQCRDAARGARQPKAGRRENKMMERLGDWMQTYTGHAFWPLDPRADEVEIEDIAHALSMQCRYAGHCRVFYSVAEHSCYVSDYCREHALWGLLHDASEAYLTDVVRPIKRSLANYADIETGVMAAVCKRFGLPIDVPAIVKRVDNAILVNERDQIMAKPPHDWNLLEPPLPNLRIAGWSPARAKREFLRQFNKLYSN